MCLNYQQQLLQQIQQQQQQQQELNKLNENIECSEIVQNTTKVQVDEYKSTESETKRQSKRKYIKRSISAIPNLESIDEGEELTSSPDFCASLSPLPSPSPVYVQKMNASAPVFVPDSNSQKEECEEIKKYKKMSLFRPKHAARAKLNIYIPKHMTKTLLSEIEEVFPNTGTLYYYLDISTALQINDKQMNVLETTNNQKIVLIHFDLHSKRSKKLIYGVITPNDEHKIEANTHKWLWKIDEFLTAQEIYNKYEIDEEDLPQSSRLMKNGLYDQLIEQLNRIDEIHSDEMLMSYNWSQNEIKQIGSSQKTKKGKRQNEMKLILNTNYWIHKCVEYGNYLSPIPIVVYENRELNQHWLEWVKMIYIEQDDSFIGLSYKFNNDLNKWQIESICLDKGDIHNKHRLIGLQNYPKSKLNLNYHQCFERFNTRITEVQFR